MHGSLLSLVKSPILYFQLAQPITGVDLHFGSQLDDSGTYYLLLNDALVVAMMI